VNQIVFLDINHKDDWDIFWRGKPFVIIKVTKQTQGNKNFFDLYLLPITSQDGEEITESKKVFISQYKIRKLPDCLKINPSFVRIQRYVDLTNIEQEELVKFLCPKCSIQGCFKWEKIEGKNQNEYDFFVKKHLDYRHNKLNASKLLPPIKVDWNERKSQKKLVNKDR
jgi:hypothetical protein